VVEQGQEEVAGAWLWAVLGKADIMLGNVLVGMSIGSW